MPALLQICIVIVSFGLLALALFAVIRLTRFLSRASKDIFQLSLAVRHSVAEIDLVSHEARELLVSLRRCVSPVQGVVDRFEDLGQRAASLSSALLGEIEDRAFTASAVMHGVNTGARFFLDRIQHRLTHRHASIPGGNHHE